MNAFLVTTLFITLSSCSGISVNDSRTPSSVSPAMSTCLDLASPFLKDNRESALDIKSLLEKGLIKEKDLKFLEGKLIQDSLSSNQEDSKEMQLSYLLIKKKFPYFDEEQVLSHYQLLTQFCGL